MRSTFQPFIFFDMPSKLARRRKLTKLVTNHLIGDKDRSMRSPIVHSDRVTDHDRHDCRGPGPGYDHRATALLIGLLNFFQQLVSHVRAFV